MKNFTRAGTTRAPALLFSGKGFLSKVPSLLVLHAAVAAPPHTEQGGWDGWNGKNGRDGENGAAVAAPPHTGQHGQAGEWPSLSDGTGDWAIGRRGGSCGGGSATAYRTGLLVS